MQPIWKPTTPALFREASVNRQLAREGYAVIRVGTPENAERLYRQTADMLGDFRTGKQAFYNFGQLPEPGWRRRSYEFIRDQVLPAYTDLVDPERAQLFAGTHMIKPSGPTSAFDLHQDNAMVDETRTRSYIIWMPFSAITAENGAVCVLPRSHRLGNPYRSVSIPWVLHRARKEMFRRSVPVYLEAGEALVFDTALVHHSLPNVSGQPRYAANAIVLDKQASIIKCIFRRSWFRRYIDLYSISMDYYLDQDNEARPEDHRPPLTSILYHEKRIGNAELGRMLDELEKADGRY